MILENSSGEFIRFYSVRNHISHPFSPHCDAKGGFLVCNISTIAMQRRLNCIAKGLILLCKRSPFAIAKLAQSSAHQPNLLYTNNITLHAQNSRISGKRFLYAFNSQYREIKNANIVYSADALCDIRRCMVQKNCK